MHASNYFSSVLTHQFDRSIYIVGCSQICLSRSGLTDLILMITQVNSNDNITHNVGQYSKADIPVNINIYNLNCIHSALKMQTPFLENEQSDFFSKIGVHC